MRERHSQIALESFIFSASVWAVERKGLGREKVKQGRAVLFSRTEQRGSATPPRQCSVEASQKQEPGSPSPWSCLCCVTQIDPAAQSSSVKPDRGRLPPSLRRGSEMAASKQQQPNSRDAPLPLSRTSRLRFLELSQRGRARQGPYLPELTRS